MKSGEEHSEVLEYEPGRFKVRVYIREVWSNAVGEIVTVPVLAKVPNTMSRGEETRERTPVGTHWRSSIYRICLYG